MKNPINRSGLDAGGVNLRGRCALVTGAGRGIRRACASRLAAARAEVTALDVDGGAAKRTAQEAGGSVIQADLADPGVDTLTLDADIVVNNAGLRTAAPVQELPPERVALVLQVLLEVTLGASFRVVRAVRPGYVHTPLVQAQIADQAQVHGIGEDEVVRKIMLTEPVIKRLLDRDVVAAVTAFLCSPHASFINGTSMVMDRGWRAR
jgi:3-hydroxybutyrate dehydrogenase